MYIWYVLYVFCANPHTNIHLCMHRYVYMYIFMPVQPNTFVVLMFRLHCFDGGQ